MLERSNEEIQVEETLVFDFLHGLGEAFTETIRPRDLHRLIVEGATRILDAHGAALYMVDRTGQKRLLRSTLPKAARHLSMFLRKFCDRRQSRRRPWRVIFDCDRSRRDEGIIGRVWQSGQSIVLNEFSQAPELARLRDSSFGPSSALVAPLLYGKQNMGVLAVANGPKGVPFSQGDFVVFKSIAEQSAFALYNAIIYSEANEKKRLDHDLEIARDIQRVLLPAEPPAVNGFQISALNIPAGQVSGDYFDYIQVDDERLGVAIADVSGKGVPASLIMAICRSVLRSEATRNPSPADVLQRVNRQLYPDIKEDMFISMAYLVLDHARSSVTLARAGHDAPLLFKQASQIVEKIKPPGMVVGIDSGSVFDRITNDFNVPIERGDCLLLYTDGVTEALDSVGDEFGPERMIESVRASAANGDDAKQIIRRVIDDVRNFAGSAPQNDDITLIAIRKT